MNALFVIVCYKEKYWETVVFQKLYESLINYPLVKCIDVFIYDNTDIEGWNVVEAPDIKCFNIHYVHKNSNDGISKAYNEAASYADSNKFKYLIFFDQDTSLSSDVIECYYKSMQNDYQLKVPIVYIGNKILSPSYYYGYRSFFFKNKPLRFLRLNHISCINTGLLISTELFKKNDGYNNELKLDFCDHDFIDRLKKIYNKIEVLDLNVYQDFSSITDDKEKAIFRYKIFLKDMLTFAKKRNKLIIFFNIDIPRVLILSLKYKTFEFIKLRFKVTK